MNGKKLYRATLIIWLCILTAVIVFVAIAFVSYTKPHHKTSVVMLGNDRTEEMLARPVRADILQFFGLDADPDAGARIVAFDVTDVSLNKTTAITLPPDNNGILSNSFTRKKNVTEFERMVATLLDTMTTDTTGKSHSSIYVPMAHALTELSANDADTRSLVLFSDLMENDSAISFYDRRTLALMRKNPDALKTVLLAQASLPDCSHLTVYFIYQPKDMKEDERFRTVSGFYKTWLEQRGAKVIVAANLTN